MTLFERVNGIPRARLHLDSNSDATLALSHKDESSLVRNMSPNPKLAARNEYEDIL